MSATSSRRVEGVLGAVAAAGSCGCCASPAGCWPLTPGCWGSVPGCWVSTAGAGVTAGSCALAAGASTSPVVCRSSRASLALTDSPWVSDETVQPSAGDCVSAPSTSGPA
ncbi:hypothetical protein E0H50_07010 [Kribbella sindirgiensis]|uniref:Uncharacterized protein n=1 Tax=Kribbella sindirgiensis TaxID=1124744 RepID=A0A4R0IZV2_9ACTN|nr:hypothetical protein E0H50_07010 [Kribbella sindirgiensis]